jgi:gamma-glutamyl:cysteine ligase YbdK (ATP-grasp superfamily)
MGALAVLLGLVALVRSLVIAAGRRLAERPGKRGADRGRRWLAGENRWLATRYGLKARCLRTPGGEVRTLAEDLDRLLERVSSVARETGDEPFLAAFRPVSSFESGAERQRRLYREAGDWKALTRDMTARWAQELEAGPGPRAGGAGA